MSQILQPSPYSRLRERTPVNIKQLFEKSQSHSQPEMRSLTVKLLQSNEDISYSFVKPQPRLPDGAVVTKIEEYMEEMFDSIQDKNRSEVIIRLKPRPNRNRSQGAITTGNTDQERTVIVRYPGKTEQESWKFTVILRILELVHEGLVSGNFMTKRDLYYRDPQLFKNQTIVDRYIDDVAHTIGVDRVEMNIGASAKGLVGGRISLQMKDGITIDCNVEGGVLIPPLHQIDRFILPRGLRWILIVEKEAVFHTLTRSDICDTVLMGKGFLVTGKGYPDLRTREFVHRCQEITSDGEVLIFILTDFDPDGYAIFMTYKYGSNRHAHISTTAKEAFHLGVNSQMYEEWVNHQDPNRHYTEMHLTQRDRAMAARLLEDPRLDSRDVEHGPIRDDLQRMLILNRKAEIQILCEQDHLADNIAIMLNEITVILGEFEYNPPRNGSSGGNGRVISRIPEDMIFDDEFDFEEGSGSDASYILANEGDDVEHSDGEDEALPIRPSHHDRELANSLINLVSSMNDTQRQDTRQFLEFLRNAEPVENEETPNEDTGRHT